MKTLKLQLVAVDERGNEEERIIEVKNPFEMVDPECVIIEWDIVYSETGELSK